MHIEEGEEFVYAVTELAGIKFRPGTVLVVTEDLGDSTEIEGARDFNAIAAFVPKKVKRRKK